MIKKKEAFQVSSEVRKFNKACRKSSDLRRKSGG
jgi:hypothetical protein